MKLYAPEYYKQFQCIADKCTHSCCIGWEIDIDEITDEKIFVPKTEKYLRNIAVYFIWRYFLKSVYDGEIILKINLMATSVCLLSFLFSKSDFSLENCSLIAKNFSKEIEYSDENVEALSYFCLL